MISKNQGFFSRFYRLSPKTAKNAAGAGGNSGTPVDPKLPTPSGRAVFQAALGVKI
jgi:hypothetical protein